MAASKYDKHMVKMSRKKSKFPGGWLMSEELVPGCDINIMFNWIAEKPKPNPMHLAMEAHDYPEIIFTLGMDPHHPEYLGGEIEGYIGQDRQLTKTTTALYIPENAEHGKVSWKSFEKPHMQMAIKFSGDIRQKPGPKKKPAAEPVPAGTYAKYVVDRPIRELSPPFKTTGRSNPSLTYMNNRLVPGCNIYLEYVWIWEMPSPNPIEGSHAHNYNEIVLNIGTDPKNPADLGAEIEAYMGGEKQVTDVTSAVFIPKNVPHGPVRWTRFTRPHIQMSIMLGAGDLKDAVPGGHKLK
ncbi:MAG: hypothetical protein A2Z15_04700 [Chloroflexi bacterium RBG_16_50_11]|nr:MAG: hypothetical protein A2Z15_04700 [Chloroflexi bacterium RBG_16_50_11]